MKTHFKVVDGNIVYNVADEEKVLEELEEFLNEQYKSEDGYESLGFTVERCNDMEGPEDENPMEVLRIAIADSDDLCIEYKASVPMLVNENGRFIHYWDFALASVSQTNMYDSEDDDAKVVGYLEDGIIDRINEVGEQ